jgi:hypothetical protein
MDQVLMLDGWEMQLYAIIPSLSLCFLNLDSANYILSESKQIWSMASVYINLLTPWTLNFLGMLHIEHDKQLHANY